MNTIKIIFIYLIMLLFMGCGCNDPVTTLQLYKPTELIHLEKGFGIRSHQYGGFLSSASGYTFNEPHFSFAINIKERAVLLTYPAKMFTFTWISEANPSTVFYGKCAMYNIPRTKMIEAPGLWLMASTANGNFIFVTNVKIILPLSMKPSKSINKPW